MTFGDGIDWGHEAHRAQAASTGRVPANSLELLRRAPSWGVPSGGLVVDLGCNIGRFGAPIAEAGYTYVGLDQSAEALRIAREMEPDLRFSQTFLWEDLVAVVGAKVPFAFTNAVLQHNTHAEKEQILARVAELVLPGGVFAMQESTLPHATPTQLPQELWIALLERHGFALIETWHPNPEYGLDDAYAFRRMET